MSVYVRVVGGLLGGTFDLHLESRSRYVLRSKQTLHFESFESFDFVDVLHHRLIDGGCSGCFVFVGDRCGK